MRIRAALLALTLLPCATAHAKADPPVPEAALRGAATRGMALVDRSLAVWQQQRTCFSCHHQALPIAATMLARSRGIAFDETLARKNISAGLLPLKSLDRNVQGYQQIDLSMESRYRTGRPAPSQAYRRASHGRRRARSGRLAASRRPLDDAGRAATAVVWDHHGNRDGHSRRSRPTGPRGTMSRLPSRTARARDWLLKSTPRDTADMVFRLRGLRWTEAAGCRHRSRRRCAAVPRSAPTAAGANCPRADSDAFATAT